MYKSWKNPMRLSYKIKHPFETINGVLKAIKYRRQRAVNGWCDADLWDIDSWFFNVMPQMLRKFADVTCSYPGKRTDKDGNEYEISYEEWIGILKNIASNFEKADKSANEYNLIDAENYLHNAMELFTKHFFDLWD